MVMQRVAVRAPSSSPLAVKASNTDSCSSLGIGWDATQGKGPWTVTVAAINQTPVTLSIPDASGSNFQYDWSVPLYSKKASTSAFVAVADSTGAASGVSSQISFGPSTQTCAGPSDSLDFVWFPTETKGEPQECTDWSVTWQKDSKNNGIEGQVSFTFLPEKGSPVTVSAGSSTAKGGSFKWTIPWDVGTKFTVYANDAGKSGTGGVGDLYTVTGGGKGAPNSCAASGNIGNGLPSASTTFLAASTASSSGKASTSSGSNAKSTASASASGKANTGNDAAANPFVSSKSGSNHAGVAVGATFGVLAVIALVAGLLWFLKRRNLGEGSNEKGLHQQDNGTAISPWRWSSSPYDAPVTTGKGQKWFQKASSVPSRGFKVLGDLGHDRGNSISSSFKAPFTTAHTRNKSSYSQGPSDGHRSPAMASPFTVNGGQTPSFRNIVPDDALFPPPRPMMHEERSFTGPRSPDSDRMGTPVGGQGAGLGTFDSVAKQEGFLDRGMETGYYGEGQSSRREAERSPASVRTNEYIGPIGPTKTSIYDPYTHLSHIWEDQDGVTREIQRAGDYGSGNDGHSSGVTSEVMMQDSSSYKNYSDSDRLSHHSGDALPYL